MWGKRQDPRALTDAFANLHLELCRKSSIRCFWFTPLSIPAVVLLMAPYTAIQSLLLWVAVALAAGSAALVIAYKYRSFLTTNLWGFGFASMLLGINWGLLPWIANPKDPIAQALLIIVVVAVGAVGSALNAGSFLGFQGLVLPVTASGGFYLAQVSDPRLRHMAPFAFFFYLILAAINWESRSVLTGALLASVENQELVSELEIEHQRIAATNGSLTSVNEKLTHLNKHDPLTGLLNRVGLAERMAQISAVARPGAGIAVMYLDLDGFKLVNDSLGHDFGDELLKVVARRFADGGRHAAFARLGGDEFCGVFHPVVDEREARESAERLRALLDRPIVVDQREVNVSVSVGVALGFGETRGEDLRRYADVALYRAKALGRNQVAVFDNRMQVNMTKIAIQGAAIRVAFKDGRVRPWYQPELDLRTNAIIGAEALARWIDQPDVRLAGDFMPIAEEVGIAVNISDRVVHNVIRSRGLRHREGLDPNFKYWMNVSAQQICDRARLEAFLENMERFETPGIGLGVEVTETGIIRDIKQATFALNTLRDHGVSIALDDFGTGHSSLSLLQQLPIDAVKIDRSFVRDIEVDPKDLALVRSVVMLARDLDLTVIAEGVENKRQADILRDMGCQRAQGFYYSPAVPEEELIGMLPASSLR